MESGYGWKKTEYYCEHDREVGQSMNEVVIYAPTKRLVIERLNLSIYTRRGIRKVSCGNGKVYTKPLINRKIVHFCPPISIGLWRDYWWRRRSRGYRIAATFIKSVSDATETNKEK